MFDNLNALLELPRGLGTTQLAGGFGLPAALSLSGRIEVSTAVSLNRTWLIAATVGLALAEKSADAYGVDVRISWDFDGALVRWRAVGSASRLDGPVRSAGRSTPGR